MENLELKQIETTTAQFITLSYYNLGYIYIKKNRVMLHSHDPN